MPVLFQALLKIIIVQIFYNAVLAHDYCGPLNYRQWYCSDIGSKIAYCCGHNSIQYYCCYYTAVWGLWYFWTGIGVLILLLLAIALGCYKRQHDRRQIHHESNHPPVLVSPRQPARTSTTAYENPSFPINEHSMSSNLKEKSLSSNCMETGSFSAEDNLSLETLAETHH